MSVVEPIEVKLLNFFYSGVQLYIFLSPYLCFIALLYFNLYLLGDDIWVS